MKYQVLIVKTASTYVEVDAASANEAEQLARRMMDDHQVDLPNCDFTYEAEEAIELA